MSVVCMNRKHYRRTYPVSWFPSPLLQIASLFYASYGGCANICECFWVLYCCCLLYSCGQCHDIYRVSIRYHFLLEWTRCLSFRSLGHAFEFVIVILMIFCCISVIYMFHSRDLIPQTHSSHESQTARYMIYTLFGITIILVPLTLMKVYQRWKLANSEAEIVDMVWNTKTVL